MHDTKTLLISLSVISIFFVSAAGYVVYDLRAENQQASLLMNAADASVRSIDSAASLRVAQDSSADKIVELDKAVLEEGELVPLIERIEKIGTTLGQKTTIASVTVDKAEADAHTTDPDKVHIIIGAEGSWAGSIAFLHALENLPTKVSLGNVSLVSAVSTSDDPAAPTRNIWRLQTEVVVYIFKS
ncbi:MAG: hypothetical protein V4465_01555 [Patescibacteria group bacterium]